MTSQQLALKLKTEINTLIQPSASDKTIVELYDDIIHLCKCIDPFDCYPETYDILRKYFPELPPQLP